MVCFFIVTSIIVHGSSVAIITLGRHLNTITLTKTFTTHTTNGNGKSSWMQRLPSLDTTGRSFSLQRVDTAAPSVSGHSTVETNGATAKPAGGMRRRKSKKKHRRRRELFSVLSKNNTRDREDDYEELNDLGRERLQREKEAHAATFALSTATGRGGDSEEDYQGGLEKSIEPQTPSEKSTERHTSSDNTQDTLNVMDRRSTAHIIQGLDSLSGNTGTPDLEAVQAEVDQAASRKYDLEKNLPENEGHEEEEDTSDSSQNGENLRKLKEKEQRAHVAYQENNKLIIENKEGEIIDEAEMNKPPKDEESSIASDLSRTLSNRSARSLRSLKKAVTPPNFIKMHGLVDADRNNKYYAYKIDNLLIIEDDEGEVLRRYKINTHNDKTKNISRGRSESVVSKALSAVGLKGKAQPSNSGNLETDDLKKMVRNLTPAPKGTIPPSDEEDYDDSDEGDEDEEYYDDITEQDGEDSEYSRDDDSYDDEGGDLANSAFGYNGEDEPETAIERERRLNALGQSSAPRDEDDEEEPPTPLEAQPSSGPSTAKKMKTTIGKTFHLK